MRGINRVVVSGNLTGRTEYTRTDGGTDVCSFVLASDRPSKGKTVTAYVKVNVYLDGLVTACRDKLAKGCYLVVEGELMNRSTPTGKVTEVRAREIVFLPKNSDTGGYLD